MTQLSHRLRLWLEARRERHAVRAAVRELSALGPEVLDDIGIPPEQLHDVAAALAAGRNAPPAPRHAAQILALPGRPAASHHTHLQPADRCPAACAEAPACCAA